MLTRAVQTSPDAGTAHARLMDSVKAWIDACVAKYAAAPPTDVHDQGTYTTAWEPYVRATGDPDVLAFLKRLRDATSAHFTHTGLWYHGYWTMQEAHHGTEHFELFLGMMLRLDPDDAATRAQLLDAAEHIVNGVPGIPPWFDETTGLFRSMYLGTGGVRTEPGMELNLPDHLRYVNLCLLAHQMGGVGYLDFAARYAGTWADAILAGDVLPVGLLASGPVYELAGEAEVAYRTFAGMAGHLDDDVDRAENLLASNGTGAFLALWQLTGDPRFRRALERLLDILATQLVDPDSGAAADAIRAYRRATGDTRYDAVILEAVAGLDPFAVREIGIEPVQRPGPRPHGIGKRNDAPVWFEDGAARRCNPITSAVAAEIAGHEPLATCALDLARTYFELARVALPDGRDHGCAANTVSAIARGHGRENHAGMVTATLGQYNKGGHHA